MPPFTIRRTPATVTGFTEPLEGLGEAIPLDMVYLQGGIFAMGSPEDEPDREKYEGPQHPVTVSDFFIGRYPITQAQWRFVAGLEQVERPLKPDPSQFKFKGDDRPVEQVTWYEAVEFCDRLAKYSGRPYRLPSETEWEYACQAGTQTPFAFGKTLSPELANYDCSKTYNGGPEGEYLGETTPVDHFKVANDWGLCDMHGNVYEWCQDYWHGSYEGAPEDGSAWIKDGDDSYRVLRGGSWGVSPRNCRSAYRLSSQPDARDGFIGFRVMSAAPRTLER